jgi:hypothetical protein
VLERERQREERERDSGGAGGVNIKDAKSCRCVYKRENVDLLEKK